MLADHDLARPAEVQALFNPAFLAVLATRVVEGHRQESDRDPLLPLVYVAVAMSLDSEVTSTLTMTVRSNLGAWKYTNSRTVAKIPRLCELHTERIRVALIFSLGRGLLTLDGAQIGLGLVALRRSLAGFSPDVAEAQKSARFLGRWLSISGSPATVLALLGARP